MTIYIEIFLIQNLLVNFCLLKLIHSTTKNRSTFFKLFLASIIGSISSIIAVYFIDNKLTLNAVKFLTAITMILIAFKQSKKQCIINTILLFLYTYALGGFVMNLSVQTYYTPFGFVSTGKIQIEFLCIAISLGTYIFDLVLRHIKLRIHTNNLIYNITIYHGKKSVKINAYLDTGNLINHNGQPVLILDLNTYLKLMNTTLIDFLSQKSETISTGTINGTNRLKLFQVDRIEIKQNKFKNNFNNPLIAISTKNCFKNTNYQALLSPLFL